MTDFPNVIPRPPEDSGPAGFVQAMNALTDAVENLDERPSGPTALGDLTDVDTTGQTTGDVLKYNGSEWVAADVPIVTISEDYVLTISD